MTKSSIGFTSVAASKTTPFAQRCDAKRLEKLFDLYTKAVVVILATGKIVYNLSN
jgi:hypothetical protein